MNHLVGVWKTRMLTGMCTMEAGLVRFQEGCYQEFSWRSFVLHSVTESDRIPSLF